MDHVTPDYETDPRILDKEEASDGRAFPCDCYLTRPDTEPHNLRIVQAQATDGRWIVCSYCPVAAKHNDRLRTMAREVVWKKLLELEPEPA